MRAWLQSAVLAGAVGLFGVAAVGCAPDDESGESRSDVTNIPQTSVKEQQIGNCWIYTSVAWAESLHLAATNETLDLSENWLTYWFYYQQIIDPTLYQRLLSPEAIVEGGWADMAFALMGRYGVVPEAGFRGAAPSTALENLNWELEHGDLRTRSSRSDGARVRRALDRAFGMPLETARAMDAVFGTDGTRKLADATAAARKTLGVLRAEEIRVRLPNPATHAPEAKTLADAIGTGDERYRWGRAITPVVGSDRAWLRRVQNALHDGYPLPLVWYVDFASLGRDQITFSPPAEGAFGTAGGGWHLSLLTDYGASNVPGFGTLPVGRVETRPEALAAALDDRTVIDVLRVKNSWGVRGYSFDPLTLDGYSDLTHAYYTQYAPWYTAKMVGRVTLPAGY